MALGYDGKLYILAFDHRGSFVKRFGIEGQPNHEETQRISDGKHLIFEGLEAALERGADPSVTGGLVDEQFGGPTHVLRYLGRYTHRVAISNHRIVAFDGERVTFRYKDYAHGGKQRTMTLVATEFLRRFFLHVLPRGFVRIRHFGFLANRWRTARLSIR